MCALQHERQHPGGDIPTYMNEGKAGHMLETAPPCGGFGFAGLGQWLLPMGQHSVLILTLALFCSSQSAVCKVPIQGSFLLSLVGGLGGSVLQTQRSTEVKHKCQVT